MNVKISNIYGFVIRKTALLDLGVAREDCLRVFEVEKPLDENDDFLSFGPSFGGEAANEFQRRLEDLGFVYLDDFFVFEHYIPDWCSILVSVSDKK